MKLARLLQSGGLVLGALSGVWFASACSGGGSGGGSFVEQACGSICARSKKASDALGCSTGQTSTCYQECVQQSLHCSPDKLGVLSNCVGPLMDSDFVCSGNEAIVASKCSTENADYQDSCSGSGGSSSSGGSKGSGGSSGSSSGGAGGSIGGSAGTTGGGGAGGSVTTYYCTGTPYPCSYFSGAECSAQSGCVSSTGCTGTTEPCSYFDIYGETACITQLGCSWDVDFAICDGVPYYCDEIADSTTCYSQLSCTWSDGCLGTPSSCSSFSSDSCSAQQGCYLQ